MIKPVSFRWSPELVARIDSARGDVARTIWVRRAVERALSDTQGPLTKEQADPGPVPSPEGVRSAAPAEQPVIAALRAEELRRVSPSPQVAPRVPFRRDVKPFQRGGK